MKKLLNKLVIIEFEDRESKKGVLINYSKDWFLLQSNPVDFVLDGYSVVKNYNVKKISTNRQTKFIEKAIKLKKATVDKKVHKIHLQDFDSIINSVNNNFGIFSLANQTDNAIFPGKLNKLTTKKIVLTWINLNATWGASRKFIKDEIRIIEFNTDYLTSLKLLAENK